MNLWVNRLRQLALLAVALFFFACENETSILGIPNPNSKFKGKYVEIPLETSNLLLGNIRTSNNYFSTEYNRFLVGQYVDPQFDALRAHAITQFMTTSYTKMPADYTIDSMTVVLEFDMTTYGEQGISENQQISLYEIQDPILSSKRTAYSNTVIAWDPNAKIGDEVFSVNPQLLREYDSINRTNGANEVDKIVALRFKVSEDNSFFTRLKESFEGYSFAGDSSFVKYEHFSEDFPGLAFVSSSDDNKVVCGFRIAGTSGVKIYYSKKTTSDTTYAVLNMPFSSGVLFSYNRIDADRLVGQEPFQEQPTMPGLRYIQSGTGQVVKVYLDKFFEFADEMDGKNIVFNSAQIVIENVEQPMNSSLIPPRSLGLRVLQDDNRLLKYKPEDPEQERDITIFQGLLASDYEFYDVGQPARPAVYANDSTFYAVNDAGSPSTLLYNSSDKKYSGFLTLLFQRLYKQKNDADRWRTFALYPTDPNVRDAGAKTVNRLVFPSDGVKLRLYYTEPTVNQQD